ncbi:MAG: glycosyltransferase [Saprospiraceae bacterium]
MSASVMIPGLSILSLAGFAAIILAVAYVLEIARTLRHWNRLSECIVPSGFIATTRISVIIPARNEAANIGACLQSLLHQDYPPELMEVVVVDDFSSDDTPTLVRQLTDQRVRLLELRDFVPPDGLTAYKKKAIETGIASASGTLIATTDADCVLPPLWLKTLAFLHQEKQVAFVAGPVSFFEEKNLLERFQSLDYLGMMVLTGAAIQRGQPHLANGANLAYPKTVFDAVGGFSGTDHLASGDDMLLLQKITKQYAQNIYFAKSSKVLVLTHAKATLPEFLSQRLRWASKSAAFRNRGLLWTLGVVFGLCWAILLSALIAPFAGFKMLMLFGLLFLIKSAADYALLSTACRYFGRPDLLRFFGPAQFLHIAYIAFIGLVSMFRKRYVWKGRPVQ